MLSSRSRPVRDWSCARVPPPAVGINDALVRVHGTGICGTDHWQGVNQDVAAVFDPLGNAVHTALALPVLGELDMVEGFDVAMERCRGRPPCGRRSG